MENVKKETIGLKSIVVKLLRNWTLFLYAFIFSLILSILYLSFYPYTYEVVSSVQLREDKESSMSASGLGGASGLMKSFGIGVGGGSLNVEDEIAILTSNRILRRLVADLGVNVFYTKPRSLYSLYHNSPLTLTADSSMMAGMEDEYLFKVSVRPGQIDVKASSQAGGASGSYSFSSLPGIIKLGKQEFTLRYNPDCDSKDDTYSLKIRYIPVGWMAEQLAGKINVEEVSSSSNVITMTYREHSKERGKDVLNTLIKKYNEDVIGYNNREYTKTLTLVNAQMDKISDNLKDVEKEMEMFKTANNLTMLEADVSVYGETRQMLQVSIIETESQKFLIQLLDEYVKDPDNKYSPIPGILMAGGEAMMNIILNYNEMLASRERVLKNSNETNPTFLELDAQAETLRKAVLVMIDNALKGYQQQLNELIKKDNDLFSKMKNVPMQERTYRNYRREQEIYQGFYLMLLQKQSETELAINNATERARIIEPAFVKRKKVAPRKLHAAICILVLTLAIPLGILLCKELYVSIKEEL
jgi:uncharacterized protein involved in exopolysaccharide biosynthesis